jgi:hypothetical protein
MGKKINLSLSNIALLWKLISKINLITLSGMLNLLDIMMYINFTPKNLKNKLIILFYKLLKLLNKTLRKIFFLKLTKIKTDTSIIKLLTRSKKIPKIKIKNLLLKISLWLKLNSEYFKNKKLNKISKIKRIHFKKTQIN